MKDRIRNSIYGFIVGDMYGLPYEGQFNIKNAKLIGYGTHNQPLGTWSDDTSLLLATMDSIIKKNKIDIQDIKKKYRDWLIEKKYTPFGEVFDCGGTTKKAILNNSPGNTFHDNGNGALMRMLPFSIWTFFNKSDLNLIDEYSSITHSNEISKSVCRNYVDLYHDILQKREIFNNEKIKIQKPTQSNFFVENTFSISFYSVLKSKNFLDSIKIALKFGGDTDTNCAITGSLSGAFYNKTSYKNKIVNRSFIDDLVEKFLKIL